MATVTETPIHELGAYADYFYALSIPTYAHTLSGFCRWAHSDSFPESGKISFIAKEILIDMSPEELTTHNQLKGAIASRLHLLCEDLDLGQFHHDGTFVKNKRAELATEPDGTFVSWASLERGRVRLVPRKNIPGHVIELAGSPDLVIEVVSRSSRRKDTVMLRESYFRAGVLEYWLVCALGDEIDFQLLTRGKHAFEPAEETRGWKHSTVLEHLFRISRKRDRVGLWRYRLESKRV